MDRNEVLLRGRLSAPIEERTLPSEEKVVTFRLVVKRRGERSLRGQSVDVLSCITRNPGVQRRAALWQPGDEVEVAGTLARRFWRTGSGTASVVEVDVTHGRRLPPKQDANAALWAPAGEGY